MITTFAEYLVIWQASLWNFFSTNWLSMSILLAMLIIPKITKLVRRTLGSL